MKPALAALEQRWRRFARTELEAGGLGPAAELSLRFADGRSTSWMVGAPGAELSPSPGVVFDLASLTKPLLTASLLLDALASDALSLDAEVCLAPSGSAPGFTVRELLLHRAGLAAEPSGPKLAARTRPTELELQDQRRRILNDILRAPPGHRGQECYSDLSYIALGMALEQSSGRSLRELASDALSARGLRHCATEGLWESEGGAVLGLSPIIKSRCFPSELRPWNEAAWGEVHDEAASRLGGLAGHAGLFGNGLGTFHLLEDFLANSQRWPRELLAQVLLSPQDGTRRGPWMLSQGRPGAPSYGPAWIGHTGFTGTALWFHPDGRAVSLLTSRCWPRRPVDASRINGFRRASFEMLGEGLGWDKT